MDDPEASVHKKTKKQKMKNNKIKENFSGVYRDMDFVLDKNKIIDLRQKRYERGETGGLNKCISMEDAQKIDFSDFKTEALPNAFLGQEKNSAFIEFIPNEQYKPPAFTDKLSSLGVERTDVKNKFPFSVFYRIFKKERNNETQGVKFFNGSMFAKAEVAFFILAIFFALSIWSLNLVEKSLGFEKKISETGISAFSDLASAASDISKGKIVAGSVSFLNASDKFSSIRKNIDRFGNILMVMDYLPLPKSIASKKALFEAGQNLSLAGTTMLGGFSGTLLDASGLPIRETYADIKNTLTEGVRYLDEAISDLDKVNLAYVPEKEKEKFLEARAKLPALNNALKNLIDNGGLAMKALGADSAKKYLLLFENNHEIRAGGGFIGTYGIIEIDKGKIVNFFIDDIYNPDGQLLEKIIPPQPIQRISDAWSMHDANWFADFPTSAKKVALFYEKTGGPTVDGVIAATPALIKKLLEMTGPIEMAEYGKTVDANNFTEVAQYEAEINYDKELNRPKKFIGDLWKEMEGKVFNMDKNKAVSFLETVNQLLKEKQILVYFSDSDMENFVLKNGWGGQLVDTDGDFINVVNSNLGGYKTDGVINEEISHSAEVREDGSVIDTVKITRYHLGGNTPYDWWNKVNVDYMRVYVPLGSQLISAEGHTWEKPWREAHPFDYSRFAADPDVEKIENTMFEDKNNGTQIFIESGKTVFGNWVFLSPGESVTVTYKYKLPFKVDFNKEGLAKYNLYAEKQAGSAGSRFEGNLILPDKFQTVWSYPENFNMLAGNTYRIDTNLIEDKIYGIIFKDNQ